jgi:excisionase family DNA binding protein
MDELLTTAEAAALLGVAHRTVRGYLTMGLLPVARRVNNRLILVRRAEVERLKASPPRSGPSKAPDKRNIA